MPAHTVPRLIRGRLNDGLTRRFADRRARGAFTATSCSATDDASPSGLVSPSGQPADIDGLSTIGGSGFGAATSAAGSVGTAEAAVFHAESLSAIDGTRAWVILTSCGRASQTCLQREQRTVRPATPSVESSMA
jgi:hypothetical protein